MTARVQRSIGQKDADGYPYLVAGKRDFERLHEGLDELLEDLWRVPRFSGQRGGFQPQIDVFRRENPDELVVVVELPGVDPEHVRIAIEGRLLTIAGERHRPPAECRLSYYRLELEYGAFQRRILLPEDVDVESTYASYERGMLTIVVPIAAKPPAPDRVSIPVTRR
jgi:HSP20 family protein